MELASRIRWILVLIIGVLFLFLVGWGLFSIANNLFRGNDSSVSTEVEPDYDVTTASVARFTKDGEVVATEEHRSYTIEVSERVVTIKIFKDYGQTVIAEKSFVNNTEAFDTLLSSLKNLEVTDRIKNTDSDTDYMEKGVCPRGNRYILELDNDLRRWSTSCSQREGTAGFNMYDVESLFENQIPEFRDFIRDTGL